ncbi:hypothetical protein [Helicobacter sp.]|uniref:hypothetical protein n=1 Tax=Helicobacter sp. TaxID=218 RepID=UPI0025C54A59|nr:hypothetical protein [Helicobacter sp.]MCI5968455.1 hypothetical protein [Helicobacter sp.]MDY2585240.1 hypothetical protein [Helicobacter sp.]
MSVFFGQSEKLESFFKIPQYLYGDFSVFGVDVHCKEAVEFSLKRLKENRRIEILVLTHLGFKTGFQDFLKNLHLKDLQAIRAFGTKIYFFLKESKRNPQLETYKSLAENGIVFCMY